MYWMFIKSYVGVNKGVHLTLYTTKVIVPKTITGVHKSSLHPQNFTTADAWH